MRRDAGGQARARGVASLSLKLREAITGAGPLTGQRPTILPGDDRRRAAVALDPKRS